MKTSFSHIGSYAQQVLERTNNALVSGIASRGIYLQPGNDWTLYISQEIYKGPLTLNLEDTSTKLDKIKAGSRVQFSSGEIHFPQEQITISSEDSKIWLPPPVDNDIKAIPGYLESILSIVHKLSPENPYLTLLSENPGQIPGVPVIGERILNLQNALKTGDSEGIADGSIKLLGLGPGLTPLGDDFLLGVLLSLNRWGHLLPSPLPGLEKGKLATIVNYLNQIILENTRLKTTRISASVLFCAIEGAADERLLKVLDGLFTGSLVTENELRHLLRWGNSSGITSLAGMINVLRMKDTVS